MEKVKNSVKGISPVITVSLLALLSVALVGSAFLFVNRMQSKTQEAGEGSIIYPENHRRSLMFIAIPDMAMLHFLIQQERESKER